MMDGWMDDFICMCDKVEKWEVEYVIVMILLEGLCFFPFLAVQFLKPWLWKYFYLLIS
jgi:hypothetical protein